jgi:hypothetical protein
MNGVQAEIYMEMGRFSPDDFPNPEEPSFFDQALIYLNSSYEGHSRESFMALGRHFMAKDEVTDDDITNERARQDDIYGGPTNDDKRDLSYWRDQILKYMCRYSYLEKRPSAISIVALCFAAIESIDRKTNR